MKALCTAWLFFLVTTFALGQGADPFPIAGKFYVSVDDHVRLFLNGVEVHSAGFGLSTSPQVQVRPGDRLVARLFNRVGPRSFAVMFVSTDRKTAVSFSNEMFKIVDDPELNDLTEGQFRELRKFANQQNSQTSAKALPFPNSSEWIWGQDDQCGLGSILTRGMFKPLQR